MNIIELSQDEKELVKQHYFESTLDLVKYKAQAVHMRDEGFKEIDIANAMFKGERTIQRWIKDFCDERMASLFSGHENNENASKLTREQKKEISETLQKPPSKYDLPKEFWDVPSLKHYVKAEFGVVYESVQSYHFLLKYSDLSFKYPSTFDIRRDEKKIEERMEKIRAEIEPMLEDPTWEVFASDETRIMLEAITRRAWLKKNKKTVLKVARANEYQSYIGFLNQKDFQCITYEMDWQNQDEVLRAYKKFLKRYPKKKICVIWDNAKFHTGKKIKAALKEGELLERVHLIALPPYAPDKNPIEHVWGTVKKAISNQQFKDFETTKKEFRKKLRARTFKYQV